MKGKDIALAACAIVCVGLLVILGASLQRLTKNSSKFSAGSYVTFKSDGHITTVVKTYNNYMFVRDGHEPLIKVYYHEVVSGAVEIEQ